MRKRSIRRSRVVGLSLESLSTFNTLFLLVILQCSPKMQSRPWLICFRTRQAARYFPLAHEGKYFNVQDVATSRLFQHGDERRGPESGRAVENMVRGTSGEGVKQATQPVTRYPAVVTRLHRTGTGEQCERGHRSRHPPNLQNKLVLGIIYHTKIDVIVFLLSRALASLS